MTKPMHKKRLRKKVDLSLLGTHVPGSFNILKKKKKREKQKETDHAVTSFYFIILTKSGQCRMLNEENFTSKCILFQCVFFSL
jgi:hypothetical protein